MHKISIVGANSQVGTELCFLLRDEEGIEVLPVVRNFNGAVFLNTHGFRCIIANIADPDNTFDAINDCDLVVLTAFATGPPKNSRHSNDALIKNTVRYSNNNAKIIYFSSIAAFGGQGLYTQEKRHGERLFRMMCRRHRKKGYVFRLGHVFGSNQTWTHKFLRVIKNNDVLKLKVPSNRLSNILHTVTLKNAILKCLYEEVTVHKYYSLINSPQWTWGEVFRYYAKDYNITIEFEDDKDTSISKQNGLFEEIVFKSFRYITSNSKYQDLLKTLLILLPKKYELKAQAGNFKQRALKEIRDLESSSTLSMDIFDIKPVLGPFLLGLRPAYNLLNEYNSINHIFLAP